MDLVESQRDKRLPKIKDTDNENLLFYRGLVQEHFLPLLRTNPLQLTPSIIVFISTNSQSPNVGSKFSGHVMTSNFL